MPQTLDRSHITSSRPPADPRTRALLAAGVVAGPVYIAVAAAQAFTRPGFDLRHHAVSLLSNGEGGWIQIANFVLVGILTLLGAIGIGRASRSRPGGIWLPRLIAVYGLSLIAAGLLVADPALGFPLGTPEGPPTQISWHGLGHFIAGGIGFAALTAACLVTSRTYSGRGWAFCSAVVGVVFFASFLGVASGMAGERGNLAFVAGVTLAWAWLSLTTARMLRNLSSGRSRTTGVEL